MFLTLATLWSFVAEVKNKYVYGMYFFAWYNALMDKVVLTASLIALFLMAMMMFFTSPGVVGPLGIMIFFVLIYVFFLGLAVFGCRLFFRMLGKANRIYANHIIKKSYRYGSIVALTPVIMLLCISFGGVSWFQIILTLLIEAGLCFLVSRNIA